MVRVKSLVFALIIFILGSEIGIYYAKKDELYLDGFLSDVPELLKYKDIGDQKAKVEEMKKTIYGRLKLNQFHRRINQIIKSDKNISEVEKVEKGIEFKIRVPILIRDREEMRRLFFDIKREYSILTLTKKDEINNILLQSEEITIDFFKHILLKLKESEPENRFEELIKEKIIVGKVEPMKQKYQELKKESRDKLIGDFLIEEAYQFQIRENYKVEEDDVIEAYVEIIKHN